MSFALDDQTRSDLGILPGQDGHHSVFGFYNRTTTTGGSDFEKVINKKSIETCINKKIR